MTQRETQEDELRYTSEVGRKFHADGTPRSFVGNTIISFVEPDSPIFQLAEWVQTQIQLLPYARKFALLPPSSFNNRKSDLRVQPQTAD